MNPGLKSKIDVEGKKNLNPNFQDKEIHSKTVIYQPRRNRREEREIDRETERCVCERVRRMSYGSLSWYLNLNYWCGLEILPVQQ